MFTCLQTGRRDLIIKTQIWDQCTKKRLRILIDFGKMWRGFLEHIIDGIVQEYIYN